MSTDTDALREALRHHHPIMRSETGPLSGCRCGQVKLGQDVIAHVVTELRAALDAERDQAVAAVERVRALIDPAARMAYGQWGARLFSEKAIRHALDGAA